jgi:hypothetical protein
MVESLFQVRSYGAISNSSNRNNDDEETSKPLLELGQYTADIASNERHMGLFSAVTLVSEGTLNNIPPPIIIIIAVTDA